MKITFCCKNVDIAETSLKQCKERYQEMKNQRFNPNKLFEAEFIHADCTQTVLKEKFKNSSITFDLVSIQFSFHYCFESYPQVMGMLRNASESLRVGGYFIGTTPDAFDIVRRLKQSDSNSFGNDVYSISFDEPIPETFSLFGATYKFHLDGVVDCPEFLVYFPVLEKLAKQFGLKLIYRKRFEDFFEDSKKNRQNQTLLSKMNALQAFPLDAREEANAKESDFVHAKNYMKQHHLDHSTKLGTLSKSEWEAASLYVVFVFQKEKDISQNTHKKQKVS